MGRMKELSLQHKGVRISGEVDVIHWDGEPGTLMMKPFFIKDGELTHGNIKKGINDGYFGVSAITEARISIFDSYGEQGYLQHNRDLTLDTRQCFKGHRGINRV